MIQLSERMKALARLCGSGECVADIGCDHAFLSIFLIQSGAFRRALAMDLRRGPLDAAREHISTCGLTEQITCRLSDGMQSLPEWEAEVSVIAGMGGALMQRILTQDMAKVRQMKRLVLQPQSELADFRRFLEEQGFTTVAEDIVFEDGKYYPMMAVVPGGGYLGSRKESTIDQELSHAYGGLLLAAGHPVLREYLLREEKLQRKVREQLKNAKTKKDPARIEQRLLEVEAELKRLDRALTLWEK